VPAKAAPSSSVTTAITASAILVERFHFTAVGQSFLGAAGLGGAAVSTAPFDPLSFDRWPFSLWSPCFVSCVASGPVHLRPPTSTCMLWSAGSSD